MEEVHVQLSLLDRDFVFNSALSHFPSFFLLRRCSFISTRRIVQGKNIFISAHLSCCNQAFDNFRMKLEHHCKFGFRDHWSSGMFLWWFLYCVAYALCHFNCSSYSYYIVDSPIGLPVYAFFVSHKLRVSPQPLTISL